ncbi:hypothetical protein H0N99_02495 [Candidatus Micrarchaeota archaeon]|nr:hypothetical protein [Candidatus Micrarchaeota archaeon]
MIIIDWGAWYGITFAVISLALALISIAYMLGIGFHLPKLQAWAKEELFQALASALIAVLILTFAVTIDLTMKNIYGKEPFTVATDYINKMIANLSSFFIAVVAVDASFALLQTMAFNAMPSQMGFSISPFAGLTTLTSMLSLTMEGILGGMAIMLGQSAFLSFIHDKLIIVLPIGIALRSFPWSRSAGGALIAIFLGFYIFYPFMWVFNSALYDETILQVSTMGSTPFLGSAIGGGISCASNPITCFTNTPDIGLNIILALINYLEYVVVLHLVVFVFMLSLFNLLTVLVLVNELAKILGSEIDVGGLQGLI